MKPGLVMRVARPSDSRVAIAEVDQRGLDFEVLVFGNNLTPGVFKV